VRKRPALLALLAPLAVLTYVDRVSIAPQPDPMDGHTTLGGIGACQ